MSQIKVNQHDGFKPPPLSRSQSLPSLKTPTLTPKQPQTSPRLQQQVLQSQSQSQSLSDLTSSQTLQQLSDKIDDLSPKNITEQFQQVKETLVQTKVGQTLKKVVDSGVPQLAITTGVVLSDHLDKEIPVLKVKGGELLGSLESGKLENRMLSYVSGLETETISTLQGYTDQFAKCSKTINSVCEWYSSDDNDPKLNEKRLALAKDSLVLMGGEKTLNMCEKIKQCCEDPSFDHVKEMVQSCGDFANDDSLVGTGTRKLLVEGGKLALGQTTVNVVKSSVPFLSYGTALMDTGVALSKVDDWLDGKVSGTEALKSVITAIGSGTGSTVAPIVGPLLASGVNMLIDNSSSIVDGIKSGFSWLTGWGG